VLGLSFGALSWLELDRLATFRWKATLASGSTQDRAMATKTLSRRGAKNFRDAELRGVDLRGADLGGADLRQANLEGANLSGSNLSNADLTGAKLAGSDLSRADLFSSQAGSAEGFRRARCDKLTTMPRDWTCAGGRPVPARDAKN
jgi:hypothetical protein